MNPLSLDLPCPSRLKIKLQEFPSSGLAVLRAHGAPEGDFRWTWGGTRRVLGGRDTEKGEDEVVVHQLTCCSELFCGA